MRIHIGGDHAAFECQRALVEHLTAAGHEVVDHGPTEYDALDDYPDFCIPTAEGVAADGANGVPALGVVLGGSGNGEQIAANKVHGIRAALAWSPELARLARQHNNAQVVSVGARMHPLEDVIAIVEAFVAEPFSGDERHERRIDKISQYELRP